MANEVAATQRSLDADVQDSINQMMNQENGLKLPANYAVGNALKSAFFALKGNNDGDLIQVAAHMPEMKTSIANALMDMVVQGLTPAKTQVYFIRYGNQVKMQRSYFGTQTALKRLSEVHDCWANVVHEGDGLEIGAEDDRLVVRDWKPTLEGLDKEIKYVYAVIEMADGTHQHTIMTFKQIKNSWSQTRSKGAVQNKFSDEMAKRTVLNRAAKNILNTSDDSDLVVGAINNTTSNEYDDDQAAKDVTPKKVTDLIGNADTEEPTPPESTEQTETVEPAEQEEPVDTDTDESSSGEIRSIENMKPGEKQDKDTVNNILDGLEESENHKGDGDDASSTEEGQGELFPPDVHSKF
ncbi:RecT family recombinase [Levilactobacillus brevis]|uniref:RecT family recombinase n=1 Tax=Levilactobacillus brevis TaxID=1580 RepID=UPI001C1F0876|nr:RecT family recombinase [Levilactobacillus brevis]MBU7559179.1 recombinase RecT [Levilactobacillus brevis]MCE6010713.1 recombinase RecT [Levilactobacillus brevis]MCE6025248.1 recombinase RecT [Levilactobacillus brevis]MCE6036714.1 recombinase RecT [Levilactobacillus brevis]